MIIALAFNIEYDLTKYEKKHTNLPNELYICIRDYEEGDTGDLVVEHITNATGFLVKFCKYVIIKSTGGNNDTIK